MGRRRKPAGVKASGEARSSRGVDVARSARYAGGGVAFNTLESLRRACAMRPVDRRARGP
ncbi:MAG: hypothetical protein C3F11_07755 [Methylocystaceae bacterium]|nr:MAG: hypothetical protein C3F11_07755 [Methylocystaceae bacterium]